MERQTSIIFFAIIIAIHRTVAGFQRVMKMPDDTIQPTGAGASGAAQTQQQTTAKTFTQDELNSILAREKRDNEVKMADLKKKADEWDKQQEATKSETPGRKPRPKGTL